MTAFDTDILSEILALNPAYLLRLGQIPVVNWCAPVVVLEEIIRGRLDGVRRAQAGSSRITVDGAYDLFQNALEDFRSYRTLAYSSSAESLFRTWRNTIRVGSQDLRIAAICIDHGAKLVTRNARDFALVPGLNLEVWY